MSKTRGVNDANAQTALSQVPQTTKQGAKTAELVTAAASLDSGGPTRSQVGYTAAL